MAKVIFAVLCSEKVDALGEAIGRVYPADSLPIGNGQWLIADTATAQEVSNKLGITGGEIPVSSRTVVVGVSNYFGRHYPATWEWIKTKWGS